MALAQATWDDYASDKIVEHFFLNTAFTPTTSLWIALGTNAVTAALAGEPVGNNYARIEIIGATGLSFSSPSLVDDFGKTSNSETWFFPKAQGGNWGTMQSVSIMDAVSGGNRIGGADIDGAGQAINDGEQYQINTGDLWFQNRVPDVSSALSNFTMTGAGHATFANLMLRAVGTAAPDTNIWLGLLDNDGDTQAGREAPYTDGNESEVANGGYVRLEVGDDTPGSGIGLTATVSVPGGHGFEIDTGDLDFATATAAYTNNIWFLGFYQEATLGILLGFAPLRDGGNASGFVAAPGIPVGKNSFVRVDDAGGQYQVTIT